MTTTALITKSTRHLEAGDDGPALVAMLEAWRSHRSPRIAALVEIISDRAETTRPKVPGTTTKARCAAALALIKAGDPIDLPRVIRTLADVKIAEATALAKALVVPPDPRFLRQIEALLRAPPWGTSTSRTLWRMLFDALATHGDPRTAAQLQAINLRPIIGTRACHLAPDLPQPRLVRLDGGARAGRGWHAVAPDRDPAAAPARRHREQG